MERTNGRKAQFLGGFLAVLGVLVGVGLVVAGCGDDSNVIGQQPDSGLTGEDTSDDEDTTPADAADEPDARETDSGEMDAEENDGEIDRDVGDEMGRVDSDVPGGLKLTEIDDSDAREVCETGEEYVRSKLSQEDLCLFVAHFQTGFQQPDDDSGAQMMCSNAKSGCMDREQPTVSEVCEGMTVPGGCSGVTVDQWEACEAARTDRFAMMISQAPTCSEVTADFYSSEQGGFGGEVAEECEPINQSCPDLMQDIGPTRASGGN